MSNWQHRHQVIPAVFLIFREGDKILLLKRAQTGYMDGWYSLPAGHVDGNESAALAACREAKEEVGVLIRPDQLELVHVVHEQAEGHERLNLCFEVNAYAGRLHNAEPHKCSELRWETLEALPERTVPAVRALLLQVAAHRLYSEFNFIDKKVMPT